MSATQPVPVTSTGAPVTSGNVAAAVAKGGAEFVAIVQQADPALYSQLVGSLATYSKSVAAPLVGAGVGLLVAKLGVADIVTPDLQTLLTEALVALGTAVGAAVMHWVGKAPGRLLQDAPTPPASVTGNTAQ